MKPEFLLDNQLCFRLYTASRLVTQAYHPLFSEHGLTYPQYLVLLVLWEKDAQPVNDIAKRLYLETNTVTPLIQRMEKGGILTRTKGTKDARQMIVKLTKKGKELQDQLAEVPFTVGNAVICESVTTETAPELFRMLDDMIAKLSKTDKTNINSNSNTMEAKEQVLQAMREAGQPVNAGKVAEMTGLDRKIVDKAFDALKKEGAIVSPVRCKWEPAK